MSDVTHGSEADLEKERLSVLRSYGVMGSAPDPIFDGLARTAAEFGRTPAALIGFFDSDVQWYKATFGWKLTSVPRRNTLCAAASLQTDPIIIPDTRSDPRFASHPWVISGPLIRFYASIPLISPEGQMIGTLAVFDREPHESDPRLPERLERLRTVTMGQLEVQRAAAESDRRAGRAEEARLDLEESEERFRDLFDSVGDIIVTIAPDGRVLHGNRTWLDVVGEERSRGTILEIIAASSREDFSVKFRDAVENAHAVAVETLFLTDSGGVITAEGTLTPKTVDGRTLFIRVIFRDVSEHKRILIELGKARDAALEAARLKAQFLTNVSHELRTPMHGIDGMLGLLLDTPLTTGQEEFALAARSSADSLLAIINNIIYVSQLEAGRLSVAVADFDLITNLQRIVEVMRVAASSKGLTISIDTEADLPSVWRGDIVRLRQILTNLIDNAVKFTEEGSVQVRVAKQTETTTHILLRFSITDSGIGIPEASRERLFQEFTQLDATATRRYGGIGLGLAISRQLVELLGGVIAWEPREQGGSTFWFTVPFEKMNTSTLAASASRTALPGVKVFVIDDDDANRIMLSHTLSGWGLRVRSASSPRSAVERLRSDAALGDPYRIIIFDGHMASLDGLTFARGLKSDPALSEPALVMLTDLGERLNDELVRAAGISAYLAKPVESSELFDCLTAVMPRDLHPMMSPDGASTSVAPDTPPPPPIPPEHRAAISILIVEDKPLNRTLTLAQLKALGYRAETVNDGAQAVEAWGSQRYQVILMDCQMPVMDGYEATIRIRSAEKGPRTWIIGMTANAARGDREKCLAAGMDEYLSKPTRPEDLDRSLARWFHGLR